MDMQVPTEVAQERAMATIRKITEIRQHTNADALDLVIIDGWQCVAKKGDFVEGQIVVYLEIDSWIPHDIAPFLSKGKEPREYQGVMGERLRTIRLRGELSQGLVLPLDIFGTTIYPTWEGQNVTELLGVKKWEKPLNPQLQGVARGNFPSFIRKTDQERIQNIFHKLTPEQIADTYEVTLKLDGSSTTFYIKDNHVGVCSRNLELVTDESNADNSFVKMFNKLGLKERMPAVFPDSAYAIQGELFGAGINGNWEGLNDHQFRVFDVYNIGDAQYMCSGSRQFMTEKLLGLEHVPVIECITLEQFKSVDDFLAYADRPSIHNKVAEGVVFKSLTNPDFSFKVINNKYLLGGGE